ncbi:MAG: tRNA (adenosine(37)-N6)-dimethylallyltransferase MiaA [Deltaproteobacteria bacterium HGW-Deltaproteobacteria-7]|jgi:tRNA dimethylallyltransferase|nr:MAG: tRNA (adenosine(37)-N6)-dimethylallyltransferase MiaA [Deltaproteobacteria bacterium HGW-Deltaproteobacteria-7]PKN53317.1 MAG: tRNA (adenosine(37)-N6)-dimethylallyltransferase MiaA [Deltaproteobacteria bacterium HGW-Deltaproteobacteria-13]
MGKLPLVIINSPTATGKTELAVNLALEFGGEIISADSLQVYRYLDIGTAKPTLEERRGIQHHLIDVVNPDEEFNASIFTQQARALISGLARARKPILIAGGTGLYIRALLHGMIHTPAVDEKIRNYYRQMRDSHGKKYIYDLLRERDKDAADQINPNDSVRVIRALEVLEQTGESITVKQKKHSFADCPFKTYKIGLQLDRKELKQRIIQRTERMISGGLLDEVKGLLARGYSENLKPLQSLGYKQMIGFLRNEYPWESSVNLIKRDTWQYAKRQLTWFTADKEINWFGYDSMGVIRKNVEIFWKENDLL